MKALRFHGREDVRVEVVAEPQPGPDEVKIRNAYSGICGSDLHIYYTPESSGMDFTKPHPTTGAELPQILGHEFSGEVIEVGSDVTSVVAGDNVAVWPIYYCEDCVACEAGIFNACLNIGFHGIYSKGGGMAEFTTIRADKVHKLPKSLDLKMGALVEPMAVAWHAVMRSGIQPGQTALIAGAGPIGIGLWFALRANGVETVLISEPNKARRAAIKLLGADLLIDPLVDDFGEKIRMITEGRGVDFAFDASGSGPAIGQAIEALVPRGRLVVVAVHEKGFDFNPLALVMGEKEIIGVLGYTPQDFDAVIAAMNSGSYDTNGWVETTTLDEVASAFKRLRSGQGMKILVQAI